MLEPLLSAAKSDGDHFKLMLHVDSLDGPTHLSVTSEHLQVGRINRRAVERALGNSQEIASWWSFLGFRSKKESTEDRRKILFLVCGPDP